MKHNNIVLLLIQKRNEKVSSFTRSCFQRYHVLKADNACDSTCCDTVVAAEEVVAAVVDTVAADSNAVDTVVAEVAEVVAE